MYFFLATFAYATLTFRRLQKIHLLACKLSKFVPSIF